MIFSQLQKCFLATGMFAGIVLNTAAQSDFLMGRQFGTAGNEYSLNHAVGKNGDIFIAGKTTGSFEGTNKGASDGFLVCFDSLGNNLWNRQFGSSGDEDITWSAMDEKGNIYITGTTTGDLGGRNAGKTDVFVVKYDAKGNQVWIRQFGSDSTESAQGMYTDQKGSIYVTGSTLGTLGEKSLGKSDGFLMKLDENGKPVWTVQYGTDNEDYGVAVSGYSSSSLVVCGTTWGNLGGTSKGMIDAYAVTFTDAGKQLKAMQFGTDGFDIALQVTGDKDGSIYIGGSTSGNLGSNQQGEGDCFLTRLDANGDIKWSQQFGTANHDGIRGICLNPNITGHILVSGICNLPPSWAFVRMYDKEGKLLWERNFKARGLNNDTSGKDVLIDDKGNITHLGLTGANLFGPLAGEGDVYIAKFRLDKAFMLP